jgi:uncharacterized protein YdhG (YjbR/CyaY superfamily)
MNSKPTNVDGYLSTLPDDARATLEEVRRTIKKEAPDAVESIGYGMPAFKYRGRPLVYFAASKNHCALYGIPTEIEEHREELKPYHTSKGTIRFSPGKPLPEPLVRALIRERMDRIEAAEAARKRKRPAASTRPSARGR